jgi:UDP-glucose 4-epimerase
MDNITETILLTGGFGYIGSITAVQVYKYLHSEVNQNGKKKYKVE